ncbi:ABC transporter substrate-binding protein [Parvibacter caecicola]|uniref:ABC transporter substrate-binding protein n=1 Tax=Parvibacter caecicola TaxID=747645 RepID=A0A4T9TAQ2_9ACTN|nr:ABC transporter substrate-binding protein [Parvibacter caecicola]TJW12462.1 ABC transporter substrate-binding protein [Parvibacter caecicola]
MERRTFIRLAATASLSAVLPATLWGCAGNDAPSSAPAGGDAAPEGAAAATWGVGPNGESQVIVSMTTSSEPAAGFNPLVSWGAGEHVHEPLIQSTLITTDTNLNFQNDLATSYECSDDGLLWTFRIRDDVKFTNGEPLTARDVAFTINGIVNGEAAEADLSMVREAVAVDDFTVELRMVRPNNALLYTLAVVGIVPEGAYGPDYGQNPIGSGRYMLEQWDPGQQVILRANPDYYGEKPLMERVVVVFMEEDASLAAAQSGTVDVAYTSASLAASVPAGYSLLNCGSVDSRGISLPANPAGGQVEDGDVVYAAGNDVTCDVALRRALNYGIDRARMIEHVLNGYGHEAFSVGDGMPWSSPAMKVATDVEAARQLLEEAGWALGDDGVRAKEGTRCAFDLYYAANDSTRQALAYDFADQCKELGVEVNPKGGSWDELYQHQYSDPILWGWGSNSPVELFELTYGDGWGNYAQYKNQTVDANLEAAQAQVSIEDSYGYYQAAQWDEATQTGVAPQGAATWVWLANVDHLYFERDGLKVAEQKPHPHGHGWSLVNNIDRWSWN